MLETRFGGCPPQAQRFDPGQTPDLQPGVVPDGKEATAELGRRKFLVDYRPGAGIRIAPHFYTKDEELELVIAELRKIISAYTGVRGKFQC